MTPQVIFGISVGLSLVVWALIGARSSGPHALVFRILLRPERVEIRHA